ncbi:MAG: hypothetical protein ACRCUS_01865 [Anaerovoracaceae bacterium]
MKFKRTNVIIVSVIILCFVLGLSLGCAKKVGGTYEEPEMTTEYLEGKFANKIISDGAEIVYGTISAINKNDSDYVFTIDSKEIVESDGEQKGYYIADQNLNVKLPIPNDVRISFKENSESTATIMTAKELEEDFYNNASKYKNLVFELYIMNDEAILLIAKYFE